MKQQQVMLHVFSPVTSTRAIATPRPTLSIPTQKCDWSRKAPKEFHFDSHRNGKLGQNMAFLYLVVRDIHYTGKRKLRKQNNNKKKKIEKERKKLWKKRSKWINAGPWKTNNTLIKNSWLLGCLSFLRQSDNHRRDSQTITADTVFLTDLHGEYKSRAIKS